jgi:4'-phosphopantetheinyl transferase EntD
LLFSAKEAVYKVWFPLTRKPLGFEDARLRFARGPGAAAGLEHGTFSVRLLVPLPPELIRAADGGAVDLTGRWLVGEGMVLTALTLPAAGSGTERPA